MENKNAVIVSAHGNFADGIASAVKLIAGPMENLRLVNFPEGSNFEEIDGKLKESYDQLKDYRNVLIITDLMGGTPFNRSVLALGEKENVRVLSGLNFASLFQALTSDTEDIDALADEVIEIGREGIGKYEVVVKEQHDDDGI